MKTTDLISTESLLEAVKLRRHEFEYLRKRYSAVIVPALVVGGKRAWRLWDRSMVALVLDLKKQIKQYTPKGKKS